MLGVWEQPTRHKQGRKCSLPPKAISLRLPEHLLERIRIAANKRDVPYQSLIKIWLAEKLEEAE